MDTCLFRIHYRFVLKQFLSQTVFNSQPEKHLLLLLVQIIFFLFLKAEKHVKYIYFLRVYHFFKNNRNILMLQDYRNVLHFFLLFQILLYPQRRQMIWRDHLKQRDRFQTMMTWMDHLLVENSHLSQFALYNTDEFTWTINVNLNFILYILHILLQKMKKKCLICKLLEFNAVHRQEVQQILSSNEI